MSCRAKYSSHHLLRNALQDSSRGLKGLFEVLLPMCVTEKPHMSRMKEDSVCQDLSEKESS